jgi:hypothetical protein
VSSLLTLPEVFVTPSIGFSNNYYTFYLSGALSLMEGNIAQGRGHVLKCSQLQPSFWPALFLLGTLSFQQKEYMLSIEEFQNCSTMQHYRSYSSLNMIGLAYALQV